ncbi:hypothetical protein J2X14_002411 [Pantoea alhagi]|uniref:GntR family transcriptional regulator n=1 Tax=Mixta sp. BE291 TaxID=3158787 RepID=UPI00285BA72F|nr:hypothetical protein [Pantoea alhagi]
MGNIKRDTFNEIRSKIIYGDFEKEEYINPGELSSSLGVSLIPVRETLIRLSERGLLNWQKKRGFKIASCDLQEYNSIVQIQRAIFSSAINRISSAYLVPDYCKCMCERIDYALTEKSDWHELSDIYLAYNKVIMTAFEFHIFQILSDRVHQYHSKIFTREPEKIYTKLLLLKKIINHTCNFQKNEALLLGLQFIGKEIQHDFLVD